MQAPDRGLAIPLTLWLHRPLGGLAAIAAVLVACSDPDAPAIDATAVDGLVADAGDAPPADAVDAAVDAADAPIDATPVLGWAQTFSSAGTVLLYDLAIDGAGEIYAVGYFNGATLAGQAPTSAGGIDAFVLKLAPDGQVRWLRTFGGPLSDAASSVAVRPGGIVVGGSFRDTVDFGTGPITADGADGFLLALDSAGATQWVTTAGGPGGVDFGSVAVDSAGGITMAGEFYGTVDVGGGPLVATAADAVVAKYTAAGAHVWSRTFSANAQLQEVGVVVTTGGVVVATATFSGTLTAGGGPLVSAGLFDIAVIRLGADGAHLSSARYGADGLDTVHDMIAVGDGFAIVGGFSGNVAFGGAPLIAGSGNHGFAARFTAAGAGVWSQAFRAGPGSAGVEDAAVRANGDLIVTGYHLGPITIGTFMFTSTGANHDIWVADLAGATGAPLSARSAGSPMPDVPIAVVAAGTGFALAGVCRGDDDMFGQPLVGAIGQFIVQSP